MTTEVEIDADGDQLHSSTPIPDQAQRAAIMGQLSGGILHEFNNILTVISGTIDLLADAVADRPEFSAITRLIDDAASRGARLTSQLLAFERGQPPHYHAVDVGTLLSDAARLLRPALGDHTEFAVSSDADMSMAVADPSLLMGTILKLTIAARNAMPEGGRISIVAAGVSAREDDGAATDPMDVTITVDATNRAIAGGSLAWVDGDLGTIEDLARLAGGDIAIDHRIEGGAGFEIRLRQAPSDQGD